MVQILSTRKPSQKFLSRARTIASENLGASVARAKRAPDSIVSVRKDLKYPSTSVEGITFRDSMAT